ncbi:fibronectin type III domain-containing protein [Streptomyces sp. NPDC006393]|uniref:fibronectin type III domain-containing protein n=1 Tax=Streptomyces sp. NPDC006393 TaxID=3156763 RepID=UPI0033DC6E7D
MSRAVTTASAVVLLGAASFTSAFGSEARDAKTVTADPLATWQTDGVVWSVEYARGVVYVGGAFDSVRPPGAEPGEREVARKNFAAFDAATGRLLPCAHSFTGSDEGVRALKASRDGKVLYVGGSFDRVDGGKAADAVALDTDGCALRKDFRPAMGGTVRAIDTTDSEVYLGGDFKAVDGRTRSRIASFTRSGALLPFKADIDLPVRAVVAAPEYGKVIVGGDFHHVNGEPEQALIALDPKTGSTVTSFPDWLPSRSVVKSLARDATGFYLGAEGSGTGVFDGRIAGRLSDGKMIWKDVCQGATQSVIVYDGILYSGSHAHYCAVTPGGFPDGPRRHLLAQSVRDSRILHWFPNTNEGIGEKVGPRALVMAGGILWAGGEFTKVNGKPQQGLTRFGTGGRGSAPEAAPRLAAKSQGAGKVTLTWRAAWDRDDAELTYRIYRDGALVTSIRKKSAEWDRPDMTYTDSVTPGSRHSYTITVSDGENTSPKSPAAEVTALATKRSAGEH